MPIYEYKCLQCGANVEKRQSVSDEPLTTCEKCHGTLEKQWSLSGFQFKGAGWYVTDYSRSDAPTDKDAVTGKDKTEKAPDKKSETVPSTATSGDSD